MDGQIRFEYGYVWTWKFFNPERKSCGFKNIRIRFDGASLFFFFEGKGRFVSRSLSNGDLFTCKVDVSRETHLVFDWRLYNRTHYHVWVPALDLVSKVRSVKTEKWDLFSLYFSIRTKEAMLILQLGIASFVRYFNLYLIRSFIRIRFFLFVTLVLASKIVFVSWIQVKRSHRLLSVRV